jgi:hypothetical protein
MPTSHVMKKLFVGLGAAVIGLGTFATEKAEAFTIFTDRAAWNTAVSGNPIFFEDFSNFTTDTRFGNPVDVGSFTIAESGNPATNANRIDALPLSALPFNIDGTNYAVVFTNFGATTIDLTYDIPVLAWGADFSNANDGGGEGVNLELVRNTGDVFNTIPVTVNNGFFGFVTDPVENISRITFVSRNDLTTTPTLGEVFGLDNVSATPVPEPLTVSGALAAGVFGTALKRKFGAKKAKIEA